tara:strand:- start:2247 stop:2588 length:342 start_codon:yes stop_codon:yes gene_type:complete
LTDNEDKKNIKDDYETSRDTYLELIESGKRGLDLMVEVARESEHPRAFEVLSGMIKNVADVTDKLMDLNKKHKDIKADPKADQEVTNNNVFIGSTTDLQRLLHKEEKDVTPND